MYKVHEERPDCFVVSVGDGQPFAVVKKGLSKETLAKVQGMLPQKMAWGGNPVAALEDMTAAANGPVVDLSQPQELGPQAYDSGFPLAESPDEYAVNWRSQVPDTGKAITGLATEAFDANTHTPAEAIPNKTVPVQVDQKKLDEAYAAPKPNMGSSNGVDLSTPPAPPAPSGPTPLSPEQKHNKLMAGFEAGKETEDQALDRTNQEAVEKQGEIKSRAYDQGMADIDRQNKERQQDLANWQRQKDLNEASEREWREKEPNQSRWWQNKSAANQVGSALALLVGGFSSGAIGQKNQAMEVVNDAIDKDVRSQIDKKNSMVDFFVQKGHSIDASYQMTKAMKLEQAAADAQRLALAMNKDMIAPETQIAINKLQLEAKQRRQAAQLLDLQKQQARATISKTYAEAEHLRAASRPKPNMPVGVRFVPEALNQMTPEQRQSAVPVSWTEQDKDGKYQTKHAIMIHPYGEKAAEAVREEQRQLSQLERDLNTLEELSKRGSKYFESSEAAGEIEPIMLRLTGHMKTLKRDTGAITKEEQEQYRNAAGDPTKWKNIIGDAAKGSRSQLRSMLAGERAAIQRELRGE
jgi:hypothetical protein